MKWRHELADFKWLLVVPWLPGEQGDPRGSSGNNHRFVNAVTWLA